MNDLFRALFGGQLPEALCHSIKHRRSLYSFIGGLAQTQADGTPHMNESLKHTPMSRTLHYNIKSEEVMHVIERI